MPASSERLRAALGPAYALHELVGVGGMAAVFRATDLRHDRVVAIKVLREDIASGVSLDRFRAEVRLTAGLQHPHILPLHDSGGEGDLRYYVMPFVEGARSLRTRVEEGPLRIPEAVEIAIVVAGALEYAHQRGVVHRDIKPENILLSNGVPVVADFGIARMTGAESAQLTGVGISLGTPQYMSPEQALGEVGVDGRTDIYALGATLYELLTGEPPLAGGTASSVLKRLFTEDAPRVTVRRPETPPHVAAAIARALEREADARFPTAVAFADALRAPARVSLAVDGSNGTAATPPAPATAAARVGLPTVAVLPLANVGQDPEFDYFCDGMTDELIGALSRLRGLRVASRTSSFAFKARAATVEEIGRALNVGFVLEGSVRHAAGRIRVAAQLVEVRTGHQQWADRFDRTLEDIFALQDELAATIADALSLRLSAVGEAADGSVRRGTDNLQAYELVLKGRYFWNQRALDKALGCFQQAVQLDPAYAQAWAGLADGLSFLAYYGALPPRVAFEKGRGAAERAANAGPLLAEAHYSRGLFELLLGHDFDLAGRELAKAAELGPRNGTTHATLSQYLALIGDRDGSHRAADLALQLEPLSPLVAATVGWAAVMLGEPDRAERFSLRGLDLQADSLPCTWTIGGAHLQRGDAASALPWFAKAAALSRRLPYMVALHAHTAALAGDEATARAAITELEARPDGPRPGLVAWVHAGLGDLDAAIPLYRLALGEHDPHALMPLTVPWAGRAVVADPRYREALESAGLAGLLRQRTAIAAFA